jgi:hypothetical protein
MTIAQIRTAWEGGPSSPGLTVMNVEYTGTGDLSAALAAVRAFWNANVARIPDEFTLQVEGLVNLYSEVNGQLSGEFYAGAGATPAPVLGTYTGGYAHGVGLRVDWLTSDIRNGRRVTGRSYLVPSGTNAFTTDGLLDATTVTAVSNAAQTLIDTLETAGTPLVVWSRPSVAYPVGEYTPVVSLRVPSKVAVLRGRRD